MANLVGWETVQWVVIVGLIAMVFMFAKKWKRVLKKWWDSD